MQEYLPLPPIGPNPDPDILERRIQKYIERAERGLDIFTGQPRGVEPLGDDDE